MVALVLAISVAAISPPSPNQSHSNSAAQKAAEPNPLASVPKAPFPPPQAASAQNEVKGSEHNSGTPSVVSNSWIDSWRERFQNDPITAFTLILAISTIFLWFDTRGLRKLGQHQARDTQVALRISRDAANAAKATIHSYRVAERAWLGLVDVDIKRALSHDENGQHILGYMLSLNLINSGRTPALKCRGAGDIRIEPDASGLNIPVFNIHPIDATRSSTVAPGINFQTGAGNITLQDIDRLGKNDCLAFIYGRVEYEDVFNVGVVRHAEICLQVTIYGWTSAPGTEPRHPNFRYLPAGPQNTAS